jgi:hypothetical protein
MSPNTVKIKLFAQMTIGVTRISITEDRSRKSEARDQRPEIRDQRSEIRDQRPATEGLFKEHFKEPVPKTILEKH